MLSERTKRTARRMGAFAKSAFEVLYRSGVGLGGTNVVIGTFLLCPYVSALAQSYLVRVTEANSIAIRLAPAVFVFGGVSLGLAIFLYGMFGKLPEWDCGDDPEPRQRDLNYIVVADGEHAMLRLRMPGLKRATVVLGLATGLLSLAVVLALAVADWKGHDDVLVWLWPALLGLGVFAGLLLAAVSLYDDIKEKSRRNARQQSDS